MDAIYGILSESKPGTGRAISLEASKNVTFDMVADHYFYKRDPEFLIYIYNLTEAEYKLERSGMMLSGRLTLKGKAKNEDYTLSWIVPSPVFEKKESLETYQIEPVARDGKRFAMDLLNPNNLGLDQNSNAEGLDGSNNLTKRGLFWSLNGPGASKYGRKEEPTVEEIAAARKRLEGHYRDLLDQANTVAASNPAALGNFIKAEHRAAAEYFNEAVSWNKPVVRPIAKVECPNCGEPIRANAAFHRTEAETLCVIDWKRAYNSNAVKKEDIPDEHRGFLNETKPVAPTTTK